MLAQLRLFDLEVTNRRMQCFKCLGSGMGSFRGFDEILASANF